MEVEIGFLKDAELGKTAGSVFYKENWKRKTALSIQEFYDWQFCQLPGLENEDLCCVAVEAESNRLLGIMGLHCRDYYLDTKVVRGAELTTWAVHEDSQGVGIGSRMIKFLQEEFDVLMGASITKDALPIYLKNDFGYLWHIPRYVKIHNMKKVQGYANATILGKKLVRQKAKDAYSLDYTVTEVTEEGIDYLDGVLKQNYNCSSRDKRCYDWRINKHPVFRYRAFEISSPHKQSKAILVLRHEETVSEFRLVHVIDLYGDEEAIPHALSMLNRYVDKQGVDVCDFTCTASSIVKYCLADGWFSMTNDFYIQFPHLFQPIEMKDPPTTSLIYWAKGRPISFYDTNNLYLTKQDLDLDRPTSETYQFYKERR